MQKEGKQTGSAMQDQSKRGWQNAGNGNQGCPAPRKRCEDPSMYLLAKSVWRRGTPEAPSVSSLAVHSRSQEVQGTREDGYETVKRRVLYTTETEMEDGDC